MSWWQEGPDTWLHRHLGPFACTKVFTVLALFVLVVVRVFL